MARSHTNETFDVVLAERNPNLVRLSPYVRLLDKLNVQCTVCAHDWWAVGKELTVNQTGCPECSRLSKTTSLGDLRKQLINRGIKLISSPHNMSTQAEWACEIDPTHGEWKTTASAIIHQKQGCPKCAGNIQYTDAEVATMIQEITPDVILVGKYSGMNNLASFGCNHGHTWSITPANIIHGRAKECPICKPYVHGKQFGKKTVVDNILFRSNFEAECYNVLQSSTIQFERQHRYGFNRYTCDFFVPATNHWIEVSNLKTRKYLDRINEKRAFVESLGGQFTFITRVQELVQLLELQYRISEK